LEKRYFGKTKTGSVSKTSQEKEMAIRIFALHLHPDFSTELQEIVELWNSVQDYIVFVPIRPPRKFEAMLFSTGGLSVESAEDIARDIRSESGFRKDDAIIQFCEGRLHQESEGWHQLFSMANFNGKNKLANSTISLNMMRKLASESTLVSPIFSMILSSVISNLGFDIGLDSHNVTRACIMDFDDNMSDILIGLKSGPKFCPHCVEYLKNHDGDYLLAIADSTKKMIHKSKDISQVPMRMKLRDERHINGLKEHYDITLSFAGEDRNFAELLAHELKKRNISVFYDGFEKANLWGKDLYTYLDELYRFRAEYCVIFLSKHYSKKLWTNHELKSAQAKAFLENREYILPIKLDDEEISDILPTVAYLNWNTENVYGIADLIKEKLLSER
jgi:hypothetical protein